MNPAPLSRREHVAISILQSLIVHPVAPGIPDHQIIQSAVRNADALLAELDRTAPREATPVSPECAIAHDAKNEVGFRSPGGYCNVCGEDWPVSIDHYAELGKLLGLSREQVKDRLTSFPGGPVSPPAAVLPVAPDHIPEPPADCVYWGNRPLDFPAEGKDQLDVYCFCETWSQKHWDQGRKGIASGPKVHYALCRGTPIARANGIPDQA